MPLCAMAVAAATIPGAFEALKMVGMPLLKAAEAIACRIVSAGLTWVDAFTVVLEVT